MNTVLNQQSSTFRTHPSVKRLIVAGMACCTIMLVVFVLCSLWGQFHSWPLWKARAGRLAAVAVVGVGLSASGAALQGLLRNPLAEPYLLGISSGAGIGVLVGLALGGVLPLWPWMTTPLLAFVGALITCVAVFLIAQRGGQLDPYALILSGVIINAFNGAIMLVIYVFIDPYRIPDFARWNMGQIPETVSLWLLGFCGVLVILGWGVLLLSGGRLNALSLGDDVAESCGVSLRGLRVVVFAMVSVMAAAAVALVGPVGFVGLIVPHIVRFVAGPDHRKLILLSGFGGAVFLMVAETLCSNLGPVVGVGKIPLGVLCAFCGGPFFIHLLRRRSLEVVS